jgi:hypothetical protein
VVKVRRFSSETSAFTPEQLQLRLASLVCEREQLHESGSPRESLEHNRLAIVRCQYELSYALIRRHLVPPAQQAA